MSALSDRVADRQISAEDLYKLKLWREAEPEAPEGPWYRDFGSLKICGEGALPKTFLLKGQAPLATSDAEVCPLEPGAALPPVKGLLPPRGILDSAVVPRSSWGGRGT